MSGSLPWVGILTLALVARLAFVAIAPPTIPSVDGRYYVDVARGLLEQHSFGLRVQRGPAYSVFIAGVFATFGPSLLALRIVEAVLATLLVGLIGWIGTRVFGRTAGLVSALLAAVHPVLAYLPTTQYSENLLMLVVTGALGSTFWALRRPGAWRWAMPGVLLGVALLIRPSAVFLLPGLAVGLVLAMRSAGRWVAHALVCVAAIALTLAPWIVRNRVVHGEWFFIASGAGRQLWFGNNPSATADTRIPCAISPEMQRELISLPGDLARERHLFRRGLDWEQRNPGRAASLYVLELRNLFALYPSTSTQARESSRGRGAQALASALLFAGALLSLRGLRGDRSLWVLLGLVISYALGSAFFFSVMRYRMAIEPALLWMSGSGWAGLLVARGRSEALHS